MIRDAQIPIRTTAEIRDALRAAADADRRSMASMVEMIVAGWLSDRGFLRLPDTRGAAAPAEPKRQAPKPTLSQGIAGAQAGADEAKREATLKTLTDKPTAKRKTPRSKP